MDRFEAMSLFLLAVDKGSLSAAGRQLGVPLPTLSRKISDLEAQLGAKLLIRTTRKLTLTDAGIAYAASARRILEQVDEAERTAAGEYATPKGELVLTAPILFGRLHVLPVVTEFLASFPEINIRLALSDRNAHLVDDHIDMAVRIGALADSSMVATRIGSMRHVTCVSPALLAIHGEPATPNELARFPCVALDSLPGLSSRPVNAQISMETAPEPRLSVSTAEAAVAAAIANVGFTRVLHYQAADAIARGGLKIVCAGFEREPLPIHLSHAGRGLMPLKTRSFLDFAAGKLRTRLLPFGRPPDRNTA